MSSSEVPQPWATRMTDRGFTRRDGAPNVSALARAMGVSVETARRAVKGIGTPDPETVAALIEQLGADVEDWTGQHVAGGPYVPPSESALLTGLQRDALTDLIRAIAAGQRQRAGGEHDQRSAPMTQAGDAGNNVTPLTPDDQGDPLPPTDLERRRRKTGPPASVPLGMTGLIGVDALRGLGIDAARPGTPDQASDDSTGEDSQDPEGNE